jgi:hypothetical protein
MTTNSPAAGPKAQPQQHGISTPATQQQGSQTPAPQQQGGTRITDWASI